VTVECCEGIGRLFEHLLGHGDLIAELLEIQRGHTFRCRQSDDLIVH
jgi:hypothetical protein